MGDNPSDSNGDWDRGSTAYDAEAEFEVANSNYFADNNYFDPSLAAKEAKTKKKEKKEQERERIKRSQQHQGAIVNKSITPTVFLTSHRALPTGGGEAQADPDTSPCKDGGGSGWVSSTSCTKGQSEKEPLKASGGAATIAAEAPLASPAKEIPMKELSLEYLPIGRYDQLPLSLLIPPYVSLYQHLMRYFLDLGVTINIYHPTQVVPTVWCTKEHGEGPKWPSRNCGCRT